jgi:hypothetical protein
MNLPNPKRIRPHRDLKDFLLASLRERSPKLPGPDNLPTPDDLSGAMAAYDLAYVHGRTADVTYQLDLISAILLLLPFEMDTWIWMLRSPFLQAVFTSLVPDNAPAELLVPTLDCLTSILSYPPSRAIDQFVTGANAANFQIVPVVLLHMDTVPEEARRRYLITLAVLSRLYAVPIGKVFERIAALAVDGSDKTTGLVTIDDVRGQMQKYLEGSFAGREDAVLEAVAFFTGFVRDGIQIAFAALAPADIPLLYRAMALACRHFSDCCDSFQEYDFEGADHEVFGMLLNWNANLGPRYHIEVRKSLLIAAKAVASLTPKRLGWSLSAAIHFGDPEAPDGGIAGLSITKVVLTEQWDHGDAWDLDDFCSWVFGTFQARTADGKYRLLLCLNSFLCRLKPELDPAFFDDLKPLLIELMLMVDLEGYPSGEKTRSLVRGLILYCIEHGLCNWADFDECNWQPPLRRPEDVAPRPDENDEHLPYSVIEGEVHHGPGRLGEGTQQPLEEEADEADADEADADEARAGEAEVDEAEAQKVTLGPETDDRDYVDLLARFDLDDDEEEEEEEQKEEEEEEEEKEEEEEEEEDDDEERENRMEPDNEEDSTEVLA